ncbi:HIT-like domain-containing protein [Xylariomycetidae sp. FL2044]|nr:HIT-like domain-containing protein [Xylariomycetidae sp. FL2044]
MIKPAPSSSSSPSSFSSSDAVNDRTNDQLHLPPPPDPKSPPSPPPPPPPSSSCPFCAISQAYPPYDPTNPPSASSSSSTTSSSSSHPHPLSPSRVHPSPSAFVVLATPTLIAFLDILPLSPGHLLLCPRAHRAKLGDVTNREAADLGVHLRILSRALVRATGVEDWNVVQNNGRAAAQVVDHVHYHVIPRPDISGRGGGDDNGVGRRRSFTMFGRGVRSELDEEEAEALAERLRGEVKGVFLEEEEEEEGGEGEERRKRRRRRGKL